MLQIVFGQGKEKLGIKSLDISQNGISHLEISNNESSGESKNLTT